MLEKLFRSRLRAKLLSDLFSNPGNRFFARELGRAVGESHGNIIRELARLEEIEIVASQKQAREKYYWANPDCPIFDELQGMVLKTTGLADVLKEAMKSVRGVRVAFVYGSFAGGEPAAESDVDVMVIGTARFARVVKALSPAQEKLRREVNPLVYSIPEFQEKASADHHFVRTVLQGPKIFLVGDENELAGLAGKRLNSSS